MTLTLVRKLTWHQAQRPCRVGAPQAPPELGVKCLPPWRHGAVGAEKVTEVTADSDTVQAQHTCGDSVGCQTGQRTVGERSISHCSCARSVGSPVEGTAHLNYTGRGQFAKSAPF